MDWKIGKERIALEFSVETFVISKRYTERKTRYTSGRKIEIDFVTRDDKMNPKLLK